MHKARTSNGVFGNSDPDIVVTKETGELTPGKSSHTVEAKGNRYFCGKLYR